MPIISRPHHAIPQTAPIHLNNRERARPSSTTALGQCKAVEREWDDQAMDAATEVRLRRTSSQNSNASSRRSSTVRIRPRKYASNTSLQHAPTPSDKSLTSFPSLSPSPEASPAPLANGLTPALDDVSAKLQAHTGQGTVRKVSRSTQSIVGTLVAPTTSTKSRNALFDDTPQDTRNIPGTLHLATDGHIERQIARIGAVALVRQLAEDLAQRDAQMTQLRQKAEERERVLRKMLTECEVSNLNIENRLKELDTLEVSKNLSSTPSGRKRDGSGASSQIQESTSDRMAQAMTDSLTLNEVEEEAQDAAAAGVGLNRQGTVRKINGEDDRQSIDSAHQGTRPRGTTRGWKEYFWATGNTSKKSSRRSSIAESIDEDARPHSRHRAATIQQTRRKGLNSDVFNPPPSEALRRTVSGQDALRHIQKRDDSETRSNASRRSSNSVASWALKLVAGNTQNNREADKQGTARGRPAPNAPVKRPLAVQNVPPKSGTGTPNPHITGAGKQGTLRAPNGTLRASEAARAQLGPVSPTESIGQNFNNLGPVEMDTILPEESRPPTLIQHHYMTASAEYLTDRFGFIYDQRRRKRQNEAAAALRRDKRGSNVETLGSARSAVETEGAMDDADLPEHAISPEGSRPQSPGSIDEHNVQPMARWYDFLKLTTASTELLSHMPSAAPITEVGDSSDSDAPKPSQVVVQKRGSVPGLSIVPDPEPSVGLTVHGEITQPSRSGTSTPRNPSVNQPDPVKSLLEQLTELHDSIQQEKEVRWNEFLRKVRAERKREGDAAVIYDKNSKHIVMPEANYTDGEMIGVAGLGNKGRVGRAKWREFRALVLGGIPVKLRAKIWAECSGASAAKIPGYYEDLVKSGNDDPVIVTQIQMDITRTLTDNIFFRKGPGVHKLNEVLMAYARRNPEVGYCQGMNLITACLLLIMPTAEDAFWVLASMIEDILPQKYYDHSLLTSRADQQVLRQYVAELLPKLSAHLEELEIDLEALTFQWFLSVFTDCLSAEALYRVWDVVLCINDGSTFLFQVALALLKLNERNLMGCTTPAEIYHYINHQMTNHAISIDGLIQASDALKKVVKRQDVEERRQQAVEREKEVMRQREEVRRGMKAAKEAAKATATTQSTTEGAVDSTKGGEMTPSKSRVSDDRSMEYEARPPNSSASSFRERDELEGEFETDPMQVRTPMPIDEEVMWRA